MIDPRTGEKLTQWSKLDSTLFCELVTNFLSDHELPVECNNDESNGKKVSPKLPNIKYLSFSDRIDAESKKIKLNTKQVTKELLNSSESSTTTDSDENEKIMNIKIKTNGSKASDKKDCHFKIMIPNGDRLDFLTDGDSKLKILIDYLKKEGYSKIRYELIERATTSQLVNKSRNLFNADLNSTFKQLNLYPRTFLLLQDTTA